MDVCENSKEKAHDKGKKKRYVQVPKDRAGIIRLRENGTLEIADMPEPEYRSRTTPRLFIITARSSINSPRTTRISALLNQRL